MNLFLRDADEEQLSLSGSDYRCFRAEEKFLNFLEVDGDLNMEALLVDIDLIEHIFDELASIVARPRTTLPFLFFHSNQPYYNPSSPYFLIINSHGDEDQFRSTLQHFSPTRPQHHHRESFPRTLPLNHEFP